MKNSELMRKLNKMVRYKSVIQKAVTLYTSAIIKWGIYKKIEFTIIRKPIKHTGISLIKIIKEPICRKQVSPPASTL